MDNEIRKFNQFLSDISGKSPVIEAIQKAFNVIFESTEDAVENLKKSIPKPAAVEEPETSVEEPQPVEEPAASEELSKKSDLIKP